MLRDEVTLLDITKFARTVLELMQGIDEATFIADIRTQSAVLYQLTILGEAVKRLSSEFKQAHPEISWREIAGMRDKLTHQYDRVSLDVVWLTIQQDIPNLLEQLTLLLPQKDS